MGRLERRLRDVRSVIKYLKDDDDETARQNNGKNSGLFNSDGGRPRVPFKPEILGDVYPGFYDKSGPGCPGPTLFGIRTKEQRGARAAGASASGASCGGHSKEGIQGTRQRLRSKTGKLDKCHNDEKIG